MIALEQLNEPDLKLAIVGGSPYDDYDDRLMQQWGRWIIKLPRFPVETMPEVVAAGSHCGCSSARYSHSAGSVSAQADRWHGNG